MRVTVSEIKHRIKNCSAKQAYLLTEYYLQFKTYVNLFYKIHATQMMMMMMMMMMSNIPQKHKIRELQKTAIQGTAHIRGLLEKYPTVFFYANT